MSANRCSTCSLNWPITTAYTICPRCLGSTWRVREEAAMSAEEAERELRRIKFEAEYDKRERGERSMCGKPRSGPTPEELGEQEAHAQRERIADLKALAQQLEA